MAENKYHICAGLIPKTTDDAAAENKYYITAGLIVADEEVGDVPLPMAMNLYRQMRS